jgi:tetratricopeptide (TPR) repeat protein
MRAAAVAPLLVVSALLLGGWKASAQAEDLSPGQTKTLAAGGERSSLLASSPETQGDVLVARGNYAAALDAYQQAWPRTAVTWNKVGVAYHHLFALDEALKSYKQALVIDPRYASAYNNLGAVYHGKREFALAEKAYKRAIKYEPRIAISYCNLGTTYFAESKYKKGIKAYRQALELDPDVFNPDRRAQIEESSSREQRVAIAYSLAEAYAGAGRTNEALASLRKAFASGFSDRKRLMEDKELASLRKTTEFHQLLVEEQME